MKHTTTLTSTLLALGLPIAAQAACDRYPDAQLDLVLAATITVPSSLPVGSVIIQQAFSGTAPAFTATCHTATRREIYGRYQEQEPGTNIYRTEVPGIGIRVLITDARGKTNAFGLQSQTAVMNPGHVPSFTGAQAMFIKIGPAPNGEVKSGVLWKDRWGTVPDNFQLRIGNSIRFVTPAATCDLATGDANRTISLDPVRVSAFHTATSAGERTFELTAHCSDASNVTFRFAGTPAARDNARFANTGTAGGISLWLYSRIGGANQTINANGTDSTRTVAVSGNRAVLPLGAAYFKTGVVSQGTLASTATVTLTYN